MTSEFHKLREQPFGVTPEPRSLYLSQTYREAIESIPDGVSSARDFTVLVADHGLGKTTPPGFHSCADDVSNTLFLYRLQRAASGDLFRSGMDELRIPHKVSNLGLSVLVAVNAIGT